MKQRRPHPPEPRVIAIAACKEKPMPASMLALLATLATLALMAAQRLIFLNSF
ncbi:MAG: hypothetical protein VKJ04_02375 [Vampirovibrionales bacterium]|nr:hypothetical protein [Vampirovibrionales bacterium]